MPNANLEDVSLYYEESGQGEPVLLVPPSWWPAATWNVGVVPCSANVFARSSSIAVERDAAANRRTDTRSNNSLRTALRFWRI